MLTNDTLSRNLFVPGLVLLGEGMMLGLLLGSKAVLMIFVQTLVSAIPQKRQKQTYARSAAFVESEIGAFAFTKGGGNNDTGLLVADHLCFLGVASLLSTVVAPLFFFGRSQGHSVASMTTISQVV